MTLTSPTLVPYSVAGATVVRTVIVTPPVTDWTSYPVPQAGPAIIRSFLEEHGHRVDLVDLAIRVRHANRFRVRRPYDLRLFFADRERVRRFLTGGADAALADISRRLVREARLEDCDVAGFSIPSIDSLVPALCIARVLKEGGRPVVVVGGAVFERGDHRGVLDLGWVDCLVEGDGEEPMLHIVEACAGGRPVGTGVAGLHTRDTRGTAGSAAYPLERKRVASFDPEDLRCFRALSPRGASILPYLLTRGCRFKCSFCSDYRNVRFAYTPADKIVQDVGLLLERHRPEAIYFLESNINNDPERVRELSERILAEGLRFAWGGLGTIWGLDEPLVRLMARAGCRFLFIGIESGSEGTLEDMNIGKCKRLDDIRGTLALLHAHGIRTHTFYIVEFPHETDADFERSLGLLRDTARYVTTAQANVFELIEDAPVYLRPDAFGVRLRDAEDPHFRFLAGTTERPFDEVGGRPWEERQASGRRKMRRFSREIFRQVTLPLVLRTALRDPAYLVRRAIDCPYFSYDLYLR
jgi:radical SAM superfamily enzyme YgiQ (UPF0313 family)